MARDIQATTIHAALVRKYGFTGSYSAVKRLVRRIRAAEPPEVTLRLVFTPGEAAQVDFGPVLTWRTRAPVRSARRGSSL
ncbi:hypothetical protein MQE22_05405 [Acidithiobacillus sp. YTS05]|nr:hypothetical protein MQE22_05405 [Acidithiobacillus sp. YTS05]